MQALDAGSMQLWAIMLASVSVRHKRSHLTALAHTRGLPRVGQAGVRVSMLHDLLLTFSPLV